MNINLPTDIIEIINKITKNGFEAFVVGGAVRSLLMNKEPNDFDIATNALPIEIEKIFYEYEKYDVGKKYGTICVKYKSTYVEITTYRIDSNYENGRRPKEVFFSSKLEEDLSRRDFTINAIAYNTSVGLIDLHNGINDIKNKLIKTVGNPDKRFNEDYLRMLRAIRFAVVLNFNIETNTRESIKLNSAYIGKISKERVSNELLKILLSDNICYAMNLIHCFSLENFLFNNIFEKQNYTKFFNYYNYLNIQTDNIKERIVCFLYTSFIILKTSNELYGFEEYKIKAIDFVNKFNINTIVKKDIIDFLEIIYNIKNFLDKWNIKILLNKYEYKKIEELCFILKILNMEYEFLEKEEIEQFINNLKDIMDNKEPYTLKMLNINGNDLKEIYFIEEKNYGKILKYGLDQVIKNPSMNEKGFLLDLIKSEYKEIVNG